MLREPVAHSFGRGIDRLADVDRAEIKLHRPRIDGREVEDVVDDREQGFAR